MAVKGGAKLKCCSKAGNARSAALKKSSFAKAKKAADEKAAWNVAHHTHTKKATARKHPPVKKARACKACSK
jgi:hypothetical protein